MPGLDRYPSMTGWNVVVTPVIKLYDRCHPKYYTRISKSRSLLREESTIDKRGKVKPNLNSTRLNDNDNDNFINTPFA